MYKLILNGETIRTKKELFECMGEQLELPAWFGKNLDALYDVITCDLLPKGTVEVRIGAVQKLKENLGGYADALLGMLGDIAEEDKRLTFTAE